MARSRHSFKFSHSGFGTRQLLARTCALGRLRMLPHKVVYGKSIYGPSKGSLVHSSEERVVIATRRLRFLRTRSSSTFLYVQASRGLPLIRMIAFRSSKDGGGCYSHTDLSQSKIELVSSFHFPTGVTSLKACHTGTHHVRAKGNFTSSF